MNQGMINDALGGTAHRPIPVPPNSPCRAASSAFGNLFEPSVGLSGVQPLLKPGSGRVSLALCVSHQPSKRIAQGFPRCLASVQECQQTRPRHTLYFFRQSGYLVTATPSWLPGRQAKACLMGRSQARSFTHLHFRFRAAGPSSPLPSHAPSVLS